MNRVQLVPTEKMENREIRVLKESRVTKGQMERQETRVTRELRGT